MNVFDLFAKLTLDDSEYNKGLSDAKDKASSIGGKIGRGLSTAAKVGGAAIAAAAGGIAMLSKQAISSYADYEQLAGGIETLFGDSTKTVMENANKAFTSAGMSMNEYMETSIQSAAALISSLGGDQAEAAKLMDMSIVDMSDNVNKMGTSMEAVQNAYRGFSRGNFTMLDNLALGYAGTKEGMQQLLDKAMELEAAQGRTTQFSIDSYADIVQAIHVVQDEMGITGTTQKEAADTISGSLATLKSAWSNLLTDVVNGNADISKSVNNVVSSAKNVVKNVVPAVKQALKGAGELVKELAPVIRDELPTLVNDVLPDLISAAVDLAIALGTGLAENAPQIVDMLVGAIVSNAPKLIQAAGQLVVSLASGLIQSIPTLIAGALQLFASLLGEVGNLEVKMLEAGKNLVTGLWNGISGAADWLWQQVSGWLGGLWNGIKSFFGIASPSKEMAWVGEMLAEGMAGGISDNAKDAIRAAEDMSASVMDAMSADNDYSFSTATSSERTVNHTGVIRVEGVNSQGEFMDTVDILIDQIVGRLRLEART